MVVKKKDILRRIGENIATMKFLLKCIEQTTNEDVVLKTRNYFRRLDEDVTAMKLIYESLE